MRIESFVTLEKRKQLKKEIRISRDLITQLLSRFCWNNHLPGKKRKKKKEERKRKKRDILLRSLLTRLIIHISFYGTKFDNTMNKGTSTDKIEEFHLSPVWFASESTERSLQNEATRAFAEWAEKNPIKDILFLLLFLLVEIWYSLLFSLLSFPLFNRNRVGTHREQTGQNKIPLEWKTKIEFSREAKDSADLLVAIVYIGLWHQRSEKPIYFHLYQDINLEIVRNLCVYANITF